MTITVVSFYVDRRADFPKAVDYIPLLHALDRSCERQAFRHVVLTDLFTSPALLAEGFKCFAVTLPRSLSRALTEVQARYLEAGVGSDTLFVGADCLIVKDFRAHLAPADLSIILRPGHKRHRINNGFMHVPFGSAAKVAVVFRKIANATGPQFNTCDDMVAIERTLSPMPDDYGPTERAGIKVNFLPMGVWNGGPKTVDSSPGKSFVVHFRGQERKRVMLDWAERWL